MIKALIKTMRIRQWTKNALVFFALIFDKQLFNPTAMLRTTAGFFLFCLLSSAVYIFNDISDIEGDRQHPVKKNRPIASGKLPVQVAWIAGIVLILIVLPAGYLLSPNFSLVLLGYLVLIMLYSKWLKHIPILDVMVIAAGFVLRVHSGTTLIVVERFSPWLYVVTTLGALYLGFGKRRSELALLEANAGTHRKVLDGYSIDLLDQFILIVSSTTIVAYSLYTFSAPNLPENHAMMLTIPFVLYGVFRYLYLVQSKHAGGAPEEVLLSDRPLQITILLWGLATMGVFYL